ncbi:PucR family transcriptional regulator [Pseudonocardia acaciae]|uniref:PucR family transcriptional regulator n=1 Tax=Pseudonocardia acaciae TaxID=551276 RepID=UPI00048EEA57|nr:PucR family transcriptional regulator [Pseudonocardia acaciae]
MSDELTVRDLLAVTELRLRVLAGAGGTDRRITWAHASELPDPTEFLFGGELLLLTGVSLPASGEEPRAYVRRLAAAGVAAIGFGVGMIWDRAPEPMLAEADELGLPVLEVPRPVPFLAITRAVARALQRRELAAKDYLMAAQRTLTAASVGPGGPEAVLDEVVRLVGGWALLLDPAGSVLATAGGGSGPAAALAADLDRLRDAPGSASLVSRDGDAQTWVQSLFGRAGLLGFLAVGRATPLTEAQRQVVNAAVPLCTLLLGRSQAIGRAARSVRAGALRLLLAGQSALVAEAAGELWHGLPEEPVTLLECRGGVRALAVAAERLGSDRVVYGELDGSLVCVAGSRAGADAAIRALRDIDGLRIGVSEPAGYAELGRARDQARRAAESGSGGVTHYRDLPRRDLLDLLPAAEACEFSAAVLRPLLDADRSGRGDLVRSLKIWLAHHGQWDPAAAELGIHRHTLRNRIRKAETLLGRELDSADLRAELWLALRLDERRQSPP